VTRVAVALVLLAGAACTGRGTDPARGALRGDVPPPHGEDPLGTAWHDAAQAAAVARVPDPSRGGPPVGEASSPLPPFLGVDRAGATYVGAEACAACHPAAGAAWRASSHAHALDTLRSAHAGADPRCLACHVTGLGHPGGWADRRARVPKAALDGVGCESCHGPGSAHVAAPAAGYGDLPADGSACVACHTHDTSPEFRWETRWPRVAHGR
jgi:hypothetical protein